MLDSDHYNSGAITLCGCLRRRWALRVEWVNIPLAVSLSDGCDRTHLYCLARTGRLTSEYRNGEIWLNRAESAALERDPDGRADGAREARRARLRHLRERFPTVLERQVLVNAVVGVGHRPDYIHDLPAQVRIALQGSFSARWTRVTAKRWCVRWNTPGRGSTGRAARPTSRACSPTVSRRCLSQRARP